MSVIDNDYIVLYYYSRRGLYTTERTTGWRLRTLSVLLGVCLRMEWSWFRIGLTATGLAEHFEN
jgi:hypothetical protein